MRGFATLEEANLLTTSDAPDSWGAGVVVLFLEDEEREAVEREDDVVRAGFLEELLFELLEEDLPVPVLEELLERDLPDLEVLAIISRYLLFP